MGLVGGAHDDSSEGVKILAQLRETYIRSCVARSSTWRLLAAVPPA